MFDKEFEFTGKHAQYIRTLRDELKVIRSFRDGYILCAAIGFVFNEQRNRDTITKMQPASLLPSELAKEKPRLTYIYRMIMLLHESKGFKDSDYINRTFRDDAGEVENSEKMKANMEIFNSYVLGGLEFLYEKIKDSKTTQEALDELYQIVDNFQQS